MQKHNKDGQQAAFLRKHRDREVGGDWVKILSLTHKQGPYTANVFLLSTLFLSLTLHILTFGSQSCHECGMSQKATK